jgi:uncharacterized phage protein (TIGR01671 family)
MREIKFRLWNGSVMEPVGTLSFHTDASFHVNDEYPVNDVAMEKQFGGNRYFLMQFTGLKDKNGKEIYEGDILAIGPQAYPVIWDDKGTHGWKLDTPHFGLGASQSTFYEVIGNIHENPELLP